ncbi:Fe-only nitrogenase accessory protein AnfO [Kosakonia arachidis]|uniref:Fe-only nitrogenase accessory protein AnfO n=1 Tax=Kosakonia arachidis TaxID=551989 RepID=A0A1I7DXR7_9ENTR|nr:Fe-only nitrogenase accessory AnfO family protein [Kosakonia arachidis]SFU16461.1 Fe-only nitrogenase accessory protein AnfO [Kosakonia arachidis]
MNIAVFLDRQGQVAPLTAPGTVTLFSREHGRWQIVQKIAFDLSSCTSLDVFRERTLAMLAQLPACRHFVTRDVHGAPRAWFDGLGLTLWQCTGAPEPALDTIAQQPVAPEAVTLPPQAFVRSGAELGEFYVDLIAARQAGADDIHTAKLLLVPLLGRAEFTRLELRCDHVPKWFARLADYHLQYHSTPLDDGTLRVVVTKTAS